MIKLDLQDKYLMHFPCKSEEGLGYNEAKTIPFLSKLFEGKGID